MRFTNAAKLLDLPLEDILLLLGTWDGDTCRSVRQRLQPMVRQCLEQAQNGIDELTELSGTLRAGLARLDALPDVDERCAPGCSLLESPADQRSRLSRVP